MLDAVTAHKPTPQHVSPPGLRWSYERTHIGKSFPAMTSKLLVGFVAHISLEWGGEIASSWASGEVKPAWNVLLTLSPELNT